MAHELFRLTQKIHNVPHLIEQQSFENVLSYLDSRNFKMYDEWDDEPAPRAKKSNLTNGVGVIKVNGPLVNKHTGWSAMCGGCSYENIVSQTQELVNEGAKTIVMSVDSGGGEAYGVFLASQEVRKIVDAAGVNLVGYVDGTCASAAYAMACVCDELIGNPYCEVGSIGVLIALQDRSKMMADAGIKPVFISAGKDKIPYAKDGSFRAEFLDDLQMKVDKLYQAFAEHVSTHTGLSVADVKSTEAKCFMAEDALKLGLINKIMSNSDFVEYAANLERK